jgi:hypothetical protein
MSEERKKKLRDTVAVNELSHETSLSAQPSSSSETTAREDPRAPRPGLLVESYGSSVQPVNPYKVLFEYARFLVSWVEFSY